MHPSLTGFAPLPLCHGPAFWHIPLIYYPDCHYYIKPGVAPNVAYERCCINAQKPPGIVAPRTNKSVFFSFLLLFPSFHADNLGMPPQRDLFFYCVLHSSIIANFFVCYTGIYI